MPSLRSASTETLPTTFLIRNPFLIARLVMLALFCNFAFLSLIFAAWNINITLSSGAKAPVTSILIILQSLFVFFSVGLILCDFLYLRLKPLRLIIECAGAGCLSLFHIGVAIGLTVTGPPSHCHSAGHWAMCASSSLLVPITWTNTVLALTYFLLLFIMSMAHKRLYVNIWARNVSDIEWFTDDDRLASEKAFESKIYGNPFHAYYDSFDSTGERKKKYFRDSLEDAVPAAPKMRRGIDPPFAVRSPGSSARSLTSTAVDLPSPPSKTATHTRSGSRFVEKFRESMLLVRPETPSIYSTHHRADSRSFPQSVTDVDQPIPLGRLSEWVRADALRGVNVHTHPQSLGLTP